MLTDEQCNEFRVLRCSFNDMVRAIYKAGYEHGIEDMESLVLMQMDYSKRNSAKLDEILKDKPVINEGID